ncbi:hypothetical protein DS901_16720 [Loktanella sp. D2R18]|nr:hypothetical protein DS901_16720 [Loktanella sp. D2R18]
MNKVLIFVITAAITLSACTAEKVVDNTVGGTLFVGQTAVKGAVGAGKLVVRGTGAAINAATRSE